MLMRMIPLMSELLVPYSLHRMLRLFEELSYTAHTIACPELSQSPFITTAQSVETLNDLLMMPRICASLSSTHCESATETIAE